MVGVYQLFEWWIVRLKMTIVKDRALVQDFADGWWINAEIASTTDLKLENLRVE